MYVDEESKGGRMHISNTSKLNFEGQRTVICPLLNSSGHFLESLTSVEFSPLHFLDLQILSDSFLEAVLCNSVA